MSALSGEVACAVCLCWDAGVLRYIASVRVRERARLTRLTKGLPRVTFPFVFLCIKTSAPEGTAGVIDDAVALGLASLLTEPSRSTCCSR